jgi:hypothetical protein
MKTMMPGALLFVFCLFVWTCASAQASGGPISPKEAYCLGRNQRTWTPRARFFNSTSENAENPLVSGKFPLEGLGIYFRQPNYMLQEFRAKSDGPTALFYPMLGLFEWSCRGFTPRKVY